MNQTEAIRGLTRWLIGQNSLAARLLADHPHLLPLAAGGRRTRTGPRPPTVPEPFEEESALVGLRNWLAHGLMKLMLDGVAGRVQAASLGEGFKRLVSTATETSLIMADLALRQRHHHPLLLKPQAGPGPVAVLAWGELARGEAGLDQPVGLIFIFSRRPRFSRGLARDELDQALVGPKRMTILKDYVLKLAQRVEAYLTLDHAAGPGLKLAGPDHFPDGLSGTQLTSLSRFEDFFRHQAADHQIFSLAGFAPLAGQSRLLRAVSAFSREILFSRAWDRDRLGRVVSGLRAGRGAEFDPLAGPGGLRDLGLLADAYLLSLGWFPQGSTRARLNKVVNLGGLERNEGQRLADAQATLAAAHQFLSLLGEARPGVDPPGPSELDAALALWPSRMKRRFVPATEAAGEVGRGLDRLSR